MECIWLKLWIVIAAIGVLCFEAGRFFELTMHPRTSVTYLPLHKDSPPLDKGPPPTPTPRQQQQQQQQQEQRAPHSGQEQRQQPSTSTPSPPRGGLEISSERFMPASPPADNNPLASCAVELKSFCVGEDGIHLFYPSGSPDPAFPFPYCDEMSKLTGHPSTAVERIVHNHTPPNITWEPEGYIYLPSPFHLTPWHVLLNAIAAWDTVRRHSLEKAAVVVMWARQFGFAYGPTYRPQLANASANFPLTPLYSALGKTAIGRTELGGTLRCFRRGVLGSRLWSEGLPLATVSNTYFLRYPGALLRSYMDRVLVNSGVGIARTLKDACERTKKRSVIYQRKGAGRRLDQAEEFGSALKHGGFEVEIYHAEDYSLRHQLEIAISVDVAVSAFGSGLSFLMFMRCRSAVLAIIPRLGAGGDWYEIGLNGPNTTINELTSFGAGATHLFYYTLTVNDIIPSPTRTGTHVASTGATKLNAGKQFRAKVRPGARGLRAAYVKGRTKTGFQAKGLGIYNAWRAESIKGANMTLFAKFVEHANEHLRGSVPCDMRR
eukprot:Hpha_TRINITY_DN16402_c4_g1::TRINITY_DN16402_c4_g1_i1::g.160961::m.160961